ncbi:hypothetical protein PATSB16_29800 [Pandoraea thiooxydans]|nr:hypothetical protein PATSB16_29800 [Pandoraea thiooxydans]
MSVVPFPARAVTRARAGSLPAANRHPFPFLDHGAQRRRISLAPRA